MKHPEQAKTDKNNEDALIADDKAAHAQLANYEKSIFYKLYVFSKTWWIWAIGLVGIFSIGAGALCFFDPAAIPTVVYVVETVGTIAGKIIGKIFVLAFDVGCGIFTFIKALLTKKTVPTT